MKIEIEKNHNSLLLNNPSFKRYSGNGISVSDIEKKLPEVLFITSFPPRECGIATYSQDLVKALNNKFHQSFKISLCALESENEKHNYDDEIKYFLNTDHQNSFVRLANSINRDENIWMVLVQHEFGFFQKNENDFQQLLNEINKPIVIVFHTVLPTPDKSLKSKVLQIAAEATFIVVMTNTSSDILTNDYGIVKEKIIVIPHGTHLVSPADKEILKRKYQVEGKTILSTFGLLSSGKSIETTLNALPEIVKTNPDVLFLIIGKTHPSVVKNEGEKYRNMLEVKVAVLGLESNVRFINQFLPLPVLLDYLQLTDIYLFTSKDPNQAVSGTFSYAISCGCPVISTPIPHAREVLKNDAGIIIDFENSVQLGVAVNDLLHDEQLRKNISSNGLHSMASTAWENSAIAHAQLFSKISEGEWNLYYKVPGINLEHIKKMTTDFGMIQFSIIAEPDMNSGYTLDDNARAMIALCQHYELTKDESNLESIAIYLNFIKHCLQPEGYFLNYVNADKIFTDQNHSTNLADSNGRAIWALGYLISLNEILPNELTEEAEMILQKAFLSLSKIHSTRAMAFVIKGLHYYNSKNYSVENVLLIKELANRLVQMYRHEATKDWLWFESYLTYANSILPEALLCAYLATEEITYKEIAKASFDFLLFKTFSENTLNVISNKSWMKKDDALIRKINGGEQPIDVAYTIIALSKFYSVFKVEDYFAKIQTAFDWFLGNNHLQQIIYNPATGGCYDGLEEDYVNLNQGAESTVSYLMARLTLEKSLQQKHKLENLKFQPLKMVKEIELV